MTALPVLESPKPHAIAADVTGFLQQLGGASWIHLPGRDRQGQCRARPAPGAGVPA